MSEREDYARRLREGLPEVRERIAEALRRAGRAADVQVVAVTKGHPAAAVAALRAAGLHAAGENRVQELARKVDEVGRRAVAWHLIGHLQRNKVRTAIPLFDLIQSIDSLRLAGELSREALRGGAVVTGLVQVNTSGEGTKGGFAAAAAVDAVAEIAGLPGLRIAGLMTMAPYDADERTLRRTFAGARELFDRCAALPGFDARWLSMGMSGDFEVAVEEGSTMVRLGTILFGERTP
jgi:PLP dependent protein